MIFIEFSVNFQLQTWSWNTSINTHFLVIIIQIFKLFICQCLILLSFPILGINLVIEFFVNSQRLDLTSFLWKVGLFVCSVACKMTCLLRCSHVFFNYLILLLNLFITFVSLLFIWFLFNCTKKVLRNDSVDIIIFFTIFFRVCNWMTCRRWGWWSTVWIFGFFNWFHFVF